MALTKITSSLVAINSLTAANIADNAVDATKIASNSILTRHIDDDQITGAQLADNIDIVGTLDVTGATTLDSTLGVTGAITGNLTGNASGTALTVTQAAQTAITSVGTLTGLNVSGGGSFDGDLQVGDYSATPELTLAASGNAASKINFYDSNATEGVYISSSGATYGGQINFGARWDNDNNRVTIKMLKTGTPVQFGIGTESPARPLHVFAAGSDAGVIRIENTGGGNHVAGIELISGHGSWGIYNSDTVGDALEFRDDSASATRMIITSAGNVGIGTTSPSTSHTLTVQSDSGAGAISIVGRNNGSNDESVISFYEYDGSTRQAYILSDSGYLAFAAGGSTERMRIQADGDVMVGWAAESQFYKNARVGIWENTAEKFALSVRHDGNATTSWGLSIVCGTNDASGTNTAIDIVDGDGSGQGAITFSGGTVTYGAFTANHDIELPDADNSAGYAYGTLVETTEIFYKQKDGANTERGIQYKVQKSSSANSKAVLGAYSNKYDTEDNLHQVLILGDGHILCNNSGGNIAVGDGICTSTTAGIGAKATVSPSMIIGIAQEAITFSGSETKLVPVQYGLQQFTPWT